MGGRSSSSTASSQSTQNTQNIKTTTLSAEDSAGAIIGAGDVAVTQISTDQGAVEAGKDVAVSALNVGRDVTSQAIASSEHGLDRSLDFGSEVVHTALETQAKSSAQTAGTLASAIDKAAAATRSDTSQSFQTIVKYSAIAVTLILVAMFAFRKRVS